VALGAGGVARVSDTTLEAGAYVIKAEYGGNPLHQPSSGTAATTLTVASLYGFTGFLTPLKSAGPGARRPIPARRSWGAPSRSSGS